jgi:hypothetical protein
MIENYDSVDVFIGVDVGKGEHHAVALNRAGKQLFDKALPNDEAKLRELIGQLKRHGQVLFVVDQPATIGALPIAVAQAEDVLMGYLPGLAMRRIADLHAGEARPTPATRRSSHKQPGASRTHCGHSSWSTSRSLNSRCSAPTDSRVNPTLTQHTPGTGAPFVVGLRNSADYQWVRAESNGGTVPFVNTSGGLGMRAGTLVLNTRAQGACGGDDCGLITWKFTLRYTYK